MERRRGEVVLPELLDVKQVSEYLGLHRVTVVEFARLGKLPAFKVGREWRFRADEIKAWLDRQRRPGERSAGEDEFDRLWRRLGEQAEKARVTMEDIPHVIAEVRWPEGGAPEEEGGVSERGGPEEGESAGEGEADEAGD